VGFEKGNQEWKKRKTKSPGRPPRRIEEKYRKWLLARVKKSDWDRIVDVAISRAMSGDNHARQWLSDWCLGKPIERQEHDVASEVSVTLRYGEEQADD